jgi:hypothetical protein
VSVEQTRVRHTDHEIAARAVSETNLTPFERSRQAFLNDGQIAFDNLERTFPGAPRNKELAYKLAQALVPERSRREAHFHRYRLMTKAALHGSLFSSDDNWPEASLLDIEKRTSALTDTDWSLAATYSGKGISAELGHVDQLGNWTAGRALDDAVRQLPESDVLADAGFVFGETYDRKEAAHISYEFYMTDAGVKAKRKRAAADVITESGTIYNLVKTSIFLIDEVALSDPDDIRAIRSVKRVLRDKDMTDAELIERDAIFQTAGEAIVEPFIAEKDRRERSTAVLAATSLYFALVRHR